MMNEAVPLKSAALRGLAKSPFTSNLLLYHVWQTIKEKRNCRLACSSDSWLRGYCFIPLRKQAKNTRGELESRLSRHTPCCQVSGPSFKESPTMKCPAARYLSTLPLIRRSWAVIQNHTHTRAQKSLEEVPPPSQPVDLPSHTGYNSFFYCDFTAYTSHNCVATLMTVQRRGRHRSKRSIMAFTHWMGGG